MENNWRFLFRDRIRAYGNFFASQFAYRLMLLMLVVVAGGCRLGGDESGRGDRRLARAYGKYLYENELAGLIPPNTSAADSALLAGQFVENWIRQQIVLHKAETNLPEESKQVEKQLEEYRNSLITFAYERALISQQLDTNVSDEEIQKYYDENPRNFELKDNIVMALYARVRRDAPRLDRFREWVRSENARHRNDIDAYCHQFATDFLLDDETWIPFTDLLKKVPLETYDQEHFLKNNRYIEVTDSNVVYFIRINGFRIRESQSPLSFERNNIRDMIINKRKLALVRAMEKAAYEQALRENDFEIYRHDAPTD